jgi:hypothetical protein
VSEPFDPEMSEPYFSDDVAGEYPAEYVAPHVPWWIHWRPAMVAAAVFATVVGGIVISRSSTAVPASTTTSSPTSGQCAVGAPITCFGQNRVIRDGMKGNDVRRVQQRLKDLKFDPGAVDGIYGGDTMMAVWAFQALVLKIPRNALVDFVTPVLWDAMRGDVVIAPRRQPGTPHHVEVYLPEQVIVVFTGTEVNLVSHISSGTGEKWCEEVIIDPGEEGNAGTDVIKEGWCGDAVTPGGIYRFYNRKIGLRQSKLGTMWNPVYFNFGIAVHGAMTVPKEPASHGCIRIPIFISEYFHTLVEYNDRVYVFDGVKEPEEYGSQIPPSDKRDPNYTTTTSSTTSTTVPRTTVPRTTVPKTTTTSAAPMVPGPTTP